MILTILLLWIITTAVRLFMCHKDRREYNAKYEERGYELSQQDNN